MPKPRRIMFEPETLYLARRQAHDKKRKEAAKAAGKSDAQIAYERRRKGESKTTKKPKSPPETSGQTASEAAAARRQSLTKDISGLQALQGVLTPKKPKKKR